MMLHANRFVPRESVAQADRGSLPSSPRRSLVSSMRCLSAGLCMSITTYLDDFDADLEMKRVLGVALEMTRVSLGLVDKFAAGIIAKRIIELGRAGNRKPDIFVAGALTTLRW